VFLKGVEHGGASFSSFLKEGPLAQLFLLKLDE